MLPTVGNKRSGLANKLVDNLISKPVGIFASAAGSKLAGEIGPEAGLVTGILDSITRGMGNMFKSDGGKANVLSYSDKAGKSKNKKQTANKAKEVTNKKTAIAQDKIVNVLSQQNNILKTLLVSSEKQSQKLDTLSGIHTEVRTLSSITAKVWDVSKKQLSDTRSWQKKTLDNQRKARFEKQVDTTDNEMLNEIFSGLSNSRKGFIPSNIPSAANTNKKGVIANITDAIVENAPELGAGAGILLAMKSLFKNAGTRIATGAAGLAGGAKAIFSKAPKAAGAVAPAATGVAKSSGLLSKTMSAGKNLFKTGLSAISSSGALYLGGSTLFGGGKELINAVGDTKIEDLSKAKNDIKTAYKEDGILSALFKTLTNDVTLNIASKVGKGMGESFNESLKNLGDFVLGQNARRQFDYNMQAVEDSIAKFLSRDIKTVPQTPKVIESIQNKKIQLDSMNSAITNNAGSGGNNSSTIITNNNQNNSSMVITQPQKDKRWEFNPVIGP